MVTSTGLHAGTLVRIRDERWRILEVTPCSNHLAVQVLGCERSNAGATAVFLSPADQIEPLPESATPRLVRPSQWRRSVREQLAAALPRFDALRAAVHADVTILPFQLEPALAVTTGLGCRLLIADDVGLGKTIQAGLIAAEMVARVYEARILILTPSSLRDQWRTELETRFRLPVTTLDASGVARAAAVTPPGTNPWAIHPVIVASIDYAKRPEVLRALEPLVWDALILDEAHALSGVSDRAAAAATLAARARIVVGLSATPHSGDIEAFDRLCNLGRLPDDQGLLLFRRSRSDIGLPSARRMIWLRVRVSNAELDLHRALLRYTRLVWRQPAGGHTARLAMIVLVKRACSSAVSLTRSLERRLSLLAAGPTSDDDQLDLPFAPGSDAEPDQVLAAPGLTDGRAEQRLLEDLLALARLATRSEHKLAALDRLLRRCSEPTLVFTEYRDTLAHLAAHLQLDVALVHGALTTGERREALARFTHGDARVLIATDAASEGLNLHRRCRRVVHFELPWSPTRLEQRTGRVDRLGQARRVHAVHLVGRDTPEEHTVHALLMRRARADTALSDLDPSAALEQEIVARVMAADDIRPDLQQARRVPTRLIRVSLRQQANTEAARLAGARALGARRDAVAPDLRPVVTKLPRATGRHRLWACRVGVANTWDGALFSTLIGFEAGLLDSITAAELRHWLSTGPAITASRDAAQRQLVATMDQARHLISVWLTRERAILAQVQATRGRLAPRQSQLFGRRLTRPHDTQAAILEEVVARCEQRVRDLDRAQPAGITDCHLAFAALLR